MTLDSCLLESTYACLSNKALKIKNWQLVDKNALLNSYIANEGSEMADSYLAAIILRYWSNIYRYHRMRPEVSKEIYLDLVIDGILKALSYRSWLDPKQKVSKELCGPDKVVHRCIKTTVLTYHRLSTFDCRRLDTETMYSLDKQMYSNDDETTFIDKQTSNTPNTDTTAEEVVQYYIKENKLPYAVIIDNICFQESLFKGNFSMKKLIDSINGVNDNYYDYFLSKYEVNAKELKKVITTLNTKTRRQITPYVKNIMNNISKDEKVLRWLECSTQH